MSDDRDGRRRAGRGWLHPDLRGAPLAALPFHWRWALPLWRRAMRWAATSAGEGVEVREHVEPGVRVRLYLPSANPSGAAMLWLHGGGMILGTPRSDDRRCGAWVRELGLVVVSVDYRLAPEHPYPAAIDDAHAAWRWLQGAAPDLGVDPARVAVGGASAGGGLAACLAQRLRDEARAQPAGQAAAQPAGQAAAQLLVYPMLDDRTAVRRDLDDAGHLVWHNRSNRAGWSAYVGGSLGEPGLPAYAAAARCTDLRGLPPAWIGVGDLDLFRDEDRSYAGRLEEAGVDVTYCEVAGAPHGFDAVAAGAPLAQAFATRQHAFLRECLCRAGGNGPRALR